MEDAKGYHKSMFTAMNADKIASHFYEQGRADALKQSIDEFEKTEGKAEFFNQVGVNNPELEKEKWDMGKEQFDKQMNDAREYIQSLEEAIEDEQQEIAST